MTNSLKSAEYDQKIECFHCGDECAGNLITAGDKYFCCNGCKTVYEILNQNELCDYYNLDEKPGISKRNEIRRNYDFLDDEDLIDKLIDFRSGVITTVTFNIPQIHCSSCIWILENLFKLNEGIHQSQVNFLRKSLAIKFDNTKTSIKDIVELLDSIGYLPDLNIDERDKDKSSEIAKKLYYKIGIAGFCFGNIMLLSFPEYLSLNDIVTKNIQSVFSLINVLLILPVVFYSASEYFISAWKGLKKKVINIDVPITLGVTVLFLRSIFEIATQTGPGYLDSLSALIFFLLIGRIFQNKTYEAMNFERNYKSYFPIAVTIISNGRETTIPVDKLGVGDRIIIRNSELIPADSILMSEKADIDYSFVTGESAPNEIENGSLIYAGGKQLGEAIEVETVKDVSQSYLTQLWNNEAYNKKYESPLNSLVNKISKYFTAVVLFIAASSFIYWIQFDINIAFNSFTAVLIIACPCALALSTPFTLGNSLRIFGRNNFYIKNTDVIERMASVTSIVFDKTGTITESGNFEISFEGKPLSDYESNLVITLTKNSSHPISQKISSAVSDNSTFRLTDYKETTGMGIKGIVDNHIIKLGSASFVNYKDEETKPLNSKTHLIIDDEYKGCFIVKNRYREGLTEVLPELNENYKLSLITGDNYSEEKKLKRMFGKNAELYFKQTPFDKLNYIKELKNKGEVVLMLGDGLNDAGALKESDVGISISENINNFSPASDSILHASMFKKLRDFIDFSHLSRKIIILSFIVSFLYNLIGFGFAVSGNLSPVIAAILMPLSSISVVLFTTLSTNFFAKLKGLLGWK